MNIEKTTEKKIWHAIEYAEIIWGFSVSVYSGFLLTRNGEKQGTHIKESFVIRGKTVQNPEGNDWGK